MTKKERSWILYDVANSAYSITVTAAIFPIFFKTIAAQGVEGYTSTAWWGYGNSFPTPRSRVIMFWVLSMLVASSQGGIQALSRSFYGKLIPKKRSAEFFGFYNIFGKFASILGPLLMGVTGQIAKNTSFGVLSLVILFLIGGGILTRVKEGAAVEE